MGATKIRAEIYKSFDKKKKAKAPDTPKHPGVMSYPTSTRPSGTADPNRAPNTPPRTTYDRTIRKATYGFGKDKKGKAIGQTTVVSLGKNPSAAERIKGARMARNQRPKRGTAPQAKAPKAPKGPSVASVMKSNMPKPPTFKPIDVKAQVDKHQRLAPHLPGDPHTKTTPAYVWKRSENPHLKNQAKSFSAGGIGKAVIAAGTALAAATILKQQATNRVGPKRNKSKAVESHKTRRPVAPKAPKIQAKHIGTPRTAGAEAQASPRLKAASDKRRAAEGAKLKNAGYGAPEAPKAPKAPVTPKPRSILELEEPKVETPKAPEAPKTPRTQTAPAQVVEPPKRTFFQGLRDAFTPADELAEKKASQIALRTPAPAPEPEIVTPVDKPEAKPEGRVARVAKAGPRKTAAAVRLAKKQAAALTQSIADAATPGAAAEKAASRAAIVAPVDAPAGEFDDLSPDQRKAKQDELRARVEKGRVEQEAKSAEAKTKKALDKARKENVKLGGSETKKPKAKPPKSSNETVVVEATPAEAEAVKLRDVANAKREAARLAADIHEAEKAPNEVTEQKLETTPDERRQGEQRVEGRRSPDRMTGADALEVGISRSGNPDKPRPAPQRGSRRKRGSERRITTPTVETPEVSAETKQLQTELAAASENADRVERRKKTTIRPGGNRVYDGPMTATEKAGVEAVTNPAAVAKKKQAEIAKAEKDAKTKAAAEAPADQAVAANELEAAKKRAADLAAQVEAAEVAETAHQTSRSATSSEATKAAGNEGFTPWTDEKFETATVEEKAAYKAKLELVVEGETSADAAKRKKATQKFYKDKGKRLEAQGSARQGTSTAVNPAVAGAPAAPEIETPVHKKRKSTEELMKEQGVEAKVIPAKDAPETDATTEEWDKKKKNAEATRTPLEQAKLDAAEMGTMIEEAEARKGSLGAKLKEAAGVPTDTLTADMANFEGQRLIQSKLNNAGEFETTILEGTELEKTVAEAQEDLRKGQDRRTGDATRRKFSERATAAEASTIVAASDRPARPGETKPPVGAKKGSRRKTQPGGDQRQKGSTWKPIDLVEELNKPENQRPGGLPDRRGPSLMDLDVGELKDAAARGDGTASETLRQYRAELKGAGTERRATDTAGREAARLKLDIDRAERGTPESTSSWDPKAEHPKPAPMNVEGDLMPDVKIYSGDPVKANTLERMNKRISDFEKRLKNDPNVVYKAEETLEKLKRQRDGLAQEIKIANTRQFPTLDGVRTEQAVVPGETVVPRDERRRHVRGPDGRRNVQQEPDRRSAEEKRKANQRGSERRVTPTEGLSEEPRGEQRRVEDRRTPQGTRRNRRQTQPGDRPVDQPRRSPHVGPQRGSVTIPAPDLSVGEAVEHPRPESWVKENPNMWDDSLRRAGHTEAPLTNPAIGANVDAGTSRYWEAAKRGAKNAIKGKGLKRGAGILGGFGVGTLAFMAPEVAQAYMDAPGGERERVRALGEQSLESGMEVGVGLGLFTAGVKAAQLAVPAAAPVIGATAHLGGSAIIGGIAGAAAGDIRNRYHRVQEKNRRDAAHAEEKYGTVEAATRTRKGLNAQGKPMTLDDTEELAKRWEREQAKRKKKKE